MPRRYVTTENSLAALFPDIAAQWHPAKNGDLTPSVVAAYSGKKAWWLCPHDHAYDMAIGNRTNKAQGCPYCSGNRLTPERSLARLYPQLAAEWHPTKNGDLTPDHVSAFSHKKVWWLCAAQHDYDMAVDRRTARKQGCPYCSGNRLTPQRSLVVRCPEIAAEWHPTKNGHLTPDHVSAFSQKKVWWLCAAQHDYDMVVAKRTGGRGCPYCSGKRVRPETSLAALYPQIAAEWHPMRNGDLTPDQVTPFSSRRAWWLCAARHDYDMVIAKRTGGRGCPYCSGKRVRPETSLAALYPQIAAEWHPTRNGDLTPNQVRPYSNIKVWWLCPAQHAYDMLIANRVYGGGCSYCSGRRVTPERSIAARFPLIAAQWHPTRNDDLTPDMVSAFSNKKAWWLCPRDHAYLMKIEHRAKGHGCPACNTGWTIASIREFVSGLRNHLDALTPAELYTVLQQGGLYGSHGKGSSFIRALATGRFPIDEINKFIRAKPSLVDRYIAGIPGAVTAIDPTMVEMDEPELATIHSNEDTGSTLPVVEAATVLTAIDSIAGVAADENAARFLLASAVVKLWKHAYSDPEQAVEQATSFSGGEYAQRVRAEFLREHEAAVQLAIPPGYGFAVGGVPAPPNLMQRHVAAQVRDQRRVGNWSGTGAGKTLSAVLATRVVDAGLTVICCPNSIVDGWRDKILEAFPDSAVATKTFDPVWDPGSDNLPPHRYLILNYEALQQPDSASKVKRLLEHETVDFIIVDEIHHSKQRVAENLTRRRQVLMALVSNAAAQKPDLCVLGMSATPVINNLQEGKSLVELITGVEHADLETHATVANCMALHQSLVQLGARWLPEYDLEYAQIEVPVDCSEFVDEIRSIGSAGSPLRLEQILTRARLPVIREHIVPKTLVYTYNVGGIMHELQDTLAADGWRVGFYTGDDKTGLDAFINGALDVLIGSAAIATGVDGLQQVCNRLIINVLPWTAAEFDQLKGRLFRQGQESTKVTMVVPLTYAEVNGERWSWCESKMQRLQFKRSIADAAVDGVVPEGHLESPAQAYRHLMAWLERLETGDVRYIERPRIIVPLPGDDPRDIARRHRRYGDFSKMNQRWNVTRSERTHERLEQNPEEWAQYHTLYRKAREDWTLVPYEEMIRWCKRRSGYVIGDFGCGEAQLANEISDRHIVHSFDHVAVNDEVVACDMAHVPLEDETLDVAVFSLSLMGTNLTDYVREAHRTLKIDGQLHIWEATSRFNDLDGFAEGLRKLGFDVVAVKDRWKFSHIHALKTERPAQGVEVDLRI